MQKRFSITCSDGYTIIKYKCMWIYITKYTLMNTDD
jgi:hypothetical protein